MVYEKIIYGTYVNIRSAVPEDAEETLKLRQNPQKTIFLHKLDNDVEKQRKWLNCQQEKNGDYFFVMLDKQKNMYGTVGIYDIKEKRGHSGRLLSYGNAIQSFEGQLLATRFAFEYLGLEELWCDVDEKNMPSYKFCKEFGFQFDDPIYDQELDRYVRYGTLYKKDYMKYIKKIGCFIYRNNLLPAMPWENVMKK